MIFSNLENGHKYCETMVTALGRYLVTSPESSTSCIVAETQLHDRNMEEQLSKAVFLIANMLSPHRGWNLGYFFEVLGSWSEFQINKIHLSVSDEAYVSPSKDNLCNFSTMNNKVIANSRQNVFDSVTHQLLLIICFHADMVYLSRGFFL